MHGFAPGALSEASWRLFFLAHVISETRQPSLVGGNVGAPLPELLHWSFVNWWVGLPASAPHECHGLTSLDEYWLSYPELAHQILATLSQAHDALLDTIGRTKLSLSVLAAVHLVVEAVAVAATGACGYHRTCAHQICRSISVMHGFKWPLPPYDRSDQAVVTHSSRPLRADPFETAWQEQSCGLQRQQEVTWWRHTPTNSSGLVAEIAKLAQSPEFETFSLKVLYGALFLHASFPLWSVLTYAVLLLNLLYLTLFPVAPLST